MGVFVLNLLQYQKDIYNEIPYSFNETESVLFDTLTKGKAIEEYSFDWSKQKKQDNDGIAKLVEELSSTEYEPIPKKQGIEIMKKQSINNSVLMMRCGSYFKNESGYYDYLIINIVHLNQDIYFIVERADSSASLEKTNNVEYNEEKPLYFTYQVYRAKNEEALHSIIDTKILKDNNYYIGIWEVISDTCRIRVLRNAGGYVRCFLPFIISLITAVTVCIVVQIKYKKKSAKGKT